MFWRKNFFSIRSAPFFHKERLKMKLSVEQSRTSLHETADDYAGIIAHLCPRHRIIVCKDAVQWILQQRKKGGAERPWRGVGYFLDREALIRASATLCGRIDPCSMAILAALPQHFGGAA
jgi:hypothetical protein